MTSESDKCDCKSARNMASGQTLIAKGWTWSCFSLVAVMRSDSEGWTFEDVSDVGGGLVGEGNGDPEYSSSMKSSSRRKRNSGPPLYDSQDTRVCGLSTPFASSPRTLDSAMLDPCRPLRRFLAEVDEATPGVAVVMLEVSLPADGRKSS